MPKLNLRKKALDKISLKIAMFSLAEVFSDETEARQLLNDAIGRIDKAVLLLVASDDKHQGEPTTGP